jgi:hypothetical protein
LAFAKYYEGNTKFLAASLKVISALDYLSLGHLRTTPADTVLGVKVKRYHTGHGDFMIARDLLLEFSPNSGFGWGGEAYALDLDSIEMRALSGNGENRDTTLLENVKKNGDDVYSDEYLTEIGNVIRFEQRHARMYNVAAYA